MIMEHCPWVTFDDWQWKELVWKNDINMTVWLDMNGISLYNCIWSDDRNWYAVEADWWHEWIRLREWTLELFEITTINEYNGYSRTGQLLGHSLALADLANAFQLTSETAGLTSESLSVLSLGNEGSRSPPLENSSDGSSWWPPLWNSSDGSSRWLALREWCTFFSRL